jgi:hypothetical protein
MLGREENGKKVMKLIVMGLVMLATAMTRGREEAPGQTDRSPIGQNQMMTTTVADVTGEEEASTVELSVPGESDELGESSERAQPARTPGPGEWQVACELKTGAAVVFDRRSLRGVGAMTLVRWAAPGDPRANQPVYTALVSCGEKSIEATWPGKRSDTRAGTCGRHLVDAVCEAVVHLRHATPRASSAHLPDGE